MGKKITIENTGEAAVYLPIDAANQETLNIPRAVKEKVEDKASGEAHFVQRPSRAEIDEDVLAKLRKENKAVAAYFSTGRLRVVGSGPPPAPDSGKKEGK